MIGNIIFLGAFFCVVTTVVIALGLAIYRTRKKLKSYDMCYAYKKDGIQCSGRLKCIDEMWDDHDEHFIYTCENHEDSYIHP